MEHWAYRGTSHRILAVAAPRARTGTTTSYEQDRMSSNYSLHYFTYCGSKLHVLWVLKFHHMGCPIRYDSSRNWRSIRTDTLCTAGRWLQRVLGPQARRPHRQHHPQTSPPHPAQPTPEPSLRPRGLVWSGWGDLTVISGESAACRALAPLEGKTRAVGAAHSP